MPEPEKQKKEENQEKTTNNLETIWTHYVWLSSRGNVSEDEKSKWLDIFLCRAISELAKRSTENGRHESDDEPSNAGVTTTAEPCDAFLRDFCHNNGTTSTMVASRLVSILAIELRHLCLCFETYKDVRPLKRYVFEGRGWKILYLLSRIEVQNVSEKNWISNLNPTGPSQSNSDLTIKDLVELLLNLFQLAMQNQGPVHSANGPVLRPRSALDYWEDTLHTTASKKDLEDSERLNRWMFLPESHMDKVIALWSDLSTIYSGRRNRRIGHRTHPTLQELANTSVSSVRRKQRSNPLRERSSRSRGSNRIRDSGIGRKDLVGFPSAATLTTRTVLPTNLYGLEPHFRSRSTDSETLEAAAAIGTEVGPLKLGGQQNPMDFEYFEKLVRSEDEARHQVEWMTSLRSGIAGISSRKLVQPDVAKCCAPDHGQILSFPVQETQFCLLICRLLQKIAGTEIRSRNLKTSYELSLILTQFACDELSVLSKGATTCILSHSNRYDLQMALVNLALTALAEVQFNDDHLVLLQKNNVLGLCLNVLCDCLSPSVVEQNLTESAYLAACLLNIVRTFHGVSKSAVDGNKTLTFAICNMFVDENGTVAVEKTLQLVVAAILDGKADHEDCLKLLLKELGKFLSTLGVCEVELSDLTACSKRSVQCLSSLYATLAKLTRQLTTAESRLNEDTFATLFGFALDALDLLDNVPCLHPVVVWENLLPSFYSAKIENASVRSKLTRKIFRLIQINVGHFNDVSHPSASKWRITKVNGSLSDSDSAFYASDASENRNSGDSSVHVQRLQYLLPYTRFLSSNNIDDFDESTFLSVKDTLNHLSRVLSLAGVSTRIEILAAVLIPSLESCLTKFVSNDDAAPTEVDLLLVQHILSNIRQLIRNKDALNFCHQQRLFALVISARRVDWLSDDVYRFAFHFIDQELHQIMSNATSLESLTVWSGIEVSADENEAPDLAKEPEDATPPSDNEVCHAKAVYRAFTSNVTLSEVLSLLESRSEEFVTASNLTQICLTETLTLWQLQARLVKSSDDYRSFFVQRDLLCLLNQVSRRCLHLLPTDQLEVQQVPCLIDTIGALVKLLVLLENHEDLTTRVTKHYSVKTDVTPSEILERCLRVLSDVVLEESVEKQFVRVKHCQSIVNRLFSAATSTSRCCEENSTTDFSVDFFEQTVIFASSSLDQYDADDSASASNDNEDDNEENVRPVANETTTTYSQSTKIISQKIILHIVQLIIGLGQRESSDHFSRVVEYGIAKLVTLCGNPDNLKCLVEMNLCSKLLSGLGHILKSNNTLPTSRGTLAATLLELVTILSSHKMSRDDFRAMIEFFKTSPPLPESSVALVLDNLHQIVRTTSCPATSQPSVFLTFQTAGGIADDVFSASNDATNVVLVDKLTIPSTQLHFDLPLHESDLFAQTEFSLSFWLKKLTGKKSSAKDHVFSLGTPGLLLEVWMDSSCLSVRVTSDDLVIGCATFPCSFERRSGWNHFVINCSTKLVEKLAEVQLSMNTVWAQKLRISLKSVSAGIQVSPTVANNHQTFNGESEDQVIFLLGTKDDGGCHDLRAFSIGNVLGFQGLQIDESLAAVMFSLGPDCVDFTTSQVDKKSFFFKRLLTENPRNGVKHVLPMMEGKTKNNPFLKSALATLRQFQLFVFEASRPDEIMFFRPIKSKETGKSGASLLDTLYNVAKASTPPSTPRHQQTRDLPDIVQRKFVENSNIGFRIERPWKFCQVVAREGGFHSLLLLLARTVELGCDDSGIALALDINFRTMFSNANLYNEAMQREAVLLTTRILRSEICRAGLHTVAVFFRHALTEPVIVFDDKRSIFQFCYESNAVVCDAVLFEAVFDCWKMWSKDPSSIDHEKSTSCMEAVLKACAILLRDDHPYRQFNVEIFRRMGFVRKVSYVLKSDTENVETSNASVVYQIIDLLSALVGSPPDLSIVRDLMSMALLLHDSGQMFVAHSKSNFYYLLSTPEHGAASNATGTTTWPRSRSFAGDFLRRALNGEAKNGLLKHSNSYPVLDENIVKDASPPAATSATAPSATESPSSESASPRPQQLNDSLVDDTMLMDEDYMYDTVNVSKGERGVGKKVDVDKLKQTLIGLKSKRHRQQERSQIRSEKENGPTADCSKSDMASSLRGRKVLFERPGPWGMRVPEDERDQDGGDVVGGEEVPWCKGSHVIEGVLTILFNTMQNLPDNLLTRVVSDVVLPEHLLVLCNHACSSVRNRAVRLLWQYISRTHKVEAHGFRLLKMEGYVLLANQLHQFDATEAVIDACLSIVHNRAIVLDECPEIPSHIQVTIRTPGLVPVLALMPKSVENISLAHGLILHVHELCAKVSGLLRNYKSIGLFESLCKTLHALAHADNRLTDVFGQDSREILFNDLHDFFRLIGLRFVTAHGSENYRTVEEFLLLLLHMAWSEGESAGRSEDDEKDARGVVVAFRRAVCVVVEECLTDVEARMAQIETASGIGAGRRSSDYDIYGGNLFPLEEVTDLLMRTVSPRGSVANDEDIGGSARRRRYRRHTSSTISGTVTGRSVAFWNRSPENIRLASRSEIVDRFGNLMEFVVDFITEFDLTSNPDGPDELEENFTFNLIQSLIGELHDILLAEKANARPRTLFSSSRSLRTKLLTLINFCLFPEMPFRIRVRLLRVLHNHPGCGAVLECLLRHHPEQHRLLICFIRRLVHDSKSRVADQGDETEALEETDREDCKSFYSSLEAWDLIEPTSEETRRRRGKATTDLSPSSGDDDESSMMADDDEILLNFASQLQNHRVTFKRRSRTLISKTLCQYDELTQQVTSKAVEVTKVAMKAQDDERKKFMVNIRDTLSEKVRARQLWHDVIERLTHERGLWHFPDSYPFNWRLDEMEGAQRMRIRTERSFSDINDRHYRKNCRPKTRKTANMPFAYLLQAPSGMSGVIIAQLSSCDRIRHMEQCSLVLPSNEVAGEVLMSDHSIYFVENSTDETHTDGVLSITIKLVDVREFHLRWWQLNDCAVELFLSNGCTRFLVFADRHLRNNFALQLSECQPRLSLGNPDLGHITRLWQEGTLTNFDYLMQLNKLAGRTFNDLMQYPAFPFILAVYSTEELDLTNPKSFRNLRKPISVQDPEKEDRYINNYRALSDELSRSHETSCPSVGPFHYGSHYSNTGVVLHYLVRLPPFTSMFLNYQDGNFDLADRTFHSLESAWELASGRSSSDVKELIPDLFYLPELLVNSEGFDFGTKQNGERVDDVVLPAWARGDPRLFIKIHRQALESDHVRETLNHWIDLVFGYKQSGPAAIEAINVFHPATYYGFDLNSISDPVQRKARATMIKTYGQTPKQLFKSPHPMVHKTLTSPRKASIDSDHSTRVLDHIVGLQWGSYVGSPSQADPVIVWTTKQTVPVRKFVPAANNEVYGLSANSALILKHNREGLITPFTSTNVLGACLLTWSHLDRHLRVRLKKNCPREPLLPLCCEDDALTCVNISVDATYIWIGYASGKIVAVRHTFNHRELSLDVHEDQSDGIVDLYAHRGPVNEIAPCLEFGVAVSASDDETCVIWDLRKPSYVRTVKTEFPAKLVAVSRTSGDFSVISGPTFATDNFSTMTLFTVNGSSVASQRCEPPVDSVTFSSSPEGIAVNVIATGHRSTGVIRLWNSWDLTPVRDIDTKLPQVPIVALAFSFDNQNLFASTSNGEIVIFEKASVTGLQRPPKYLNLTEM